MPLIILKALILDASIQLSIPYSRCDENEMTVISSQLHLIRKPRYTTDLTILEDVDFPIAVVAITWRMAHHLSVAHGSVDEKG